MNLQIQEEKDSGSMFSTWAAVTNGDCESMDIALSRIRQRETRSKSSHRVIDTETGKVLAYGDNFNG